MSFKYTKEVNPISKVYIGSQNELSVEDVRELLNNARLNGSEIIIEKSNQKN